jgi:REP element-mobilizing transposase RayT
MTQSLSNVILHIVFSTKDRASFIKPTIENDLYRYIGGICKNLQCPLININGYEDHIHMLVSLSRSIPISDLISKIKSNSSRWIKLQGIAYKDFAWQRGFGVFSVSETMLQTANRYLDHQKEHHKKLTFKEELVAMLKRARIPYDESTLWL